MRSWTCFSLRERISVNQSRSWSRADHHLRLDSLVQVAAGAVVLHDVTTCRARREGSPRTSSSPTPRTSTRASRRRLASRSSLGILEMSTSFCDVDGEGESEGERDCGFGFVRVRRAIDRGPRRFRRRCRFPGALTERGRDAPARATRAHHDAPALLGSFARVTSTADANDVPAAELVEGGANMNMPLMSRRGSTTGAPVSWSKTAGRGAEQAQLARPRVSPASASFSRGRERTKPVVAVHAVGGRANCAARERASRRPRRGTHRPEALTFSSPRGDTWRFSVRSERAVLCRDIFLCIVSTFNKLPF